MPVEVQREVTTTSQGPASDQLHQTTATSQVSTNAEVKDAHTDRGNAWIWYIVGVIDIALFLRLLFNLFGAKDVGFASFLYNVTDPLVSPFRGIFSNPDVNGSYFDMAAFAAIIAYVLLGWIVSRLIALATRPASSKKI